jgi:hypothetical protein
MAATVDAAQPIEDPTRRCFQPWEVALASSCHLAWFDADDLESLRLDLTTGWIRAATARCYLSKYELIEPGVSLVGESTQMLVLDAAQNGGASGNGSNPPSALDPPQQVIISTDKP